MLNCAVYHQLSALYLTIYKQRRFSFLDILIIGSGGREHTLAWKLSQSKIVDKIYAVPGNPGMNDIAECIPGSVEDNAALVKLAKDKHVGLVVVGPEVPLTNGIVDEMAQAGILSFGPSKAAAQLEGSKSFSKSIMKKYNIPTAKYEVFTDADKAKAYIEAEGAPIVIKADGLAAGKGVIVAETKEQALNAIDEIMCDKAFGSAGNSVVIEEFMEGEEASVLAFTDGKTIIPMVPSQDHKRAYDGDKGPNTGGMGTYAPAPVITPQLMAQVKQEILEPTIAAMQKEGKTYKGCLYAGLMITKDGPKVVEFNARLGDPETQVVLPLLNSDLGEIMVACAKGTLDQIKINWSDKAAACVVISAGGYPAKYRKNDEITGLEEAKQAGLLVFHAGTANKDNKIVTNGGRVLGIVAVGDDLKTAVDKVYNNIHLINFKDMYYRKDIAHRAFNRQ